MAPELFTAEWADAWRTALNASAAYRAAAAEWRDTLTVVLLADPEFGVPEDRSVFLQLFEGECREARMATANDRLESAYVIEAVPAVWQGVLRGTLAPLTAIALGKLRLAKGSLTQLMPFAAAARELVAAATALDTRYPEGWE